MTPKDIALSYLRQGLSVIPLFSPEMIRQHPPRRYTEALQKKLADNAKLPEPRPEAAVVQEAFERQCKTPIVPWAAYQARHPTEREVIEWFDQNPLANIGIVTGRISNLVVFDLDSEAALSYADKRGGFPATPKAKTGKGYHLYLRHPGFEIRNRVNPALKIDIRADGGYVAAPPSVHGTGHIYQWAGGCSIFELAPAPCEPWMIDYLRKISEGDQPGHDAQPAAKRLEGLQREPTGARAVDYAAILQNGASTGARNDTAARLTGHLLGRGMPEAKAWVALEGWNLKNRPPLGSEELRRTFESVCRSERRRQKATAIHVTHLLDTPERIITAREEGLVQVPFAGDNLSALQSKMGGGLLGGRLYILGGIPSAGKTLVINDIADNICLSGHPVLFFSYDDGREELLKRTLARFGEIPIEQLNRNRVDRDTLARLCTDPRVSTILSHKYVTEESIALNRWAEFIDAIAQRQGAPPVILIDYLRKLRTEKPIGDERLRVDEILCRLKEVAQGYNIPVVAISELARDAYKSGQRLSMASFKESGSIEYDASWLGILAAVEEDGQGEFNLVNNWERIIEDTGNLDLIVLKAKRGTGFRGRVALKTDREHMIIRDRQIAAPPVKRRANRKSQFGD